MTECLLRERKLSTDDLQMASIILANDRFRGLVGSVACTWRNGASRFSKTILDCNFLNARWCGEFREGVNRVQQSMSATAQMAPHCTTVRPTPTRATAIRPIDTS